MSFAIALLISSLSPPPPPPFDIFIIFAQNWREGREGRGRGLIPEDARMSPLWLADHGSMAGGNSSSEALVYLGGAERTESRSQVTVGVEGETGRLFWLLQVLEYCPYAKNTCLDICVICGVYCVGVYFSPSSAYISFSKKSVHSKNLKHMQISLATFLHKCWVAGLKHRWNC